MGKPIGQSEAEIDKCINHCHYYVKEAKEMMEPEELKDLRLALFLGYEI